MAKYDFNAYRQSQGKKKKNPFEEALERATKPVAPTSKKVASKATKSEAEPKVDTPKSIFGDLSKGVSYVDTEGNAVTYKQHEEKKRTAERPGEKPQTTKEDTRRNNTSTIKPISKFPDKVISSYVPGKHDYTREEYQKQRGKDSLLPEFGSYDYFKRREEKLRPIVEEMGADTARYDETYMPLVREYGEYVAGKRKTWSGQGNPLYDPVVKEMYERFKYEDEILDEYRQIIEYVDKFDKKGIHYDSKGEIDTKSGYDEASYAARRKHNVSDALANTKLIKEKRTGLYEPVSEEKQSEYDNISHISDLGDVEQSKADAYEYYEKNKDNVYDNDFFGVSAGNWKLGRTGIKTNDAGYASFKAGTDDLEAVEIYQILSDRIQKNNQEAFTNNGGVKKWWADIMQYAPQGFDQTLNTLTGYAAALPLALVSKSAFTKTGNKLAAGINAEYMFRQTAGSAFIRQLQENGLSVDDAKKLAQDEALASASVELVLSWAAGKVFEKAGGSSAVAKPMAKVSGALTNALKKLGVSEAGANKIIKSIVGAGKMILSSAGEGAEEGTQQGISIVADRYAKNGEETSAAKMLLNAFDLSKYSKEDWDQIKDAAEAGFVVGFGSNAAHAAANNIGNVVDAVDEKRTENAFIRAWTDAINKNTTQTDGVERYSLIIKHSDGSSTELQDARNLTNEQAIGYLNQAKEGTLRRETYVPVRKDTPQVVIDTLAKYGVQVDNLSLVMQVQKAQQAMSTENPGSRTTKTGDNTRKHALSSEEIIEIINNLDSPNAIILQTNRYGKDKKQLPDNVAVFVEYNKNGKEGLAVVEFDSSINPEFIGEGGDKNYHTVVTVFEPDTERNGLPYDYMEELLSNPNNLELEIERGQPTESATGEKHPNTFEDLPSFNKSIPQTESSVKENDSPNSDTVGVVRDEYTATLDEAVVNELDEIARRLGLRVEFTDGIESNKSADASIAGNLVKINKNTKRPLLKLMGHEITHHLQKISPEAYAKFEKLAMRRMGGYVDSVYARYKNAGVDITHQGAIEEAVADYAGALVYDGKVLDKFISDNRSDRGILGTVRSAVTYLKDRLTGKSKQQAQVAEGKLTDAINDGVNLENKNTAQTDGERYAVKEVLPLTDTEYKQNCKSLVNMESVADLVGNELDGGGPLKQRIEALFDSFGRNVYTERFGDVALSNSSIRSDIRHGTTKDKVTAYAAIPQVLKNGVVIDYLKKGYGEVSRIVVAAPIKIANTPYIMGAMIQRDKTNQRLYLHDVVIKKEASAYQPEHLNTTGPLDSENLFTTEVLEKALSVGYSILQNQSKIKGNPSTNFDIPEQFSIKLPEIDTDVDAVNAEDATVDEKLSQLREDYGVIPKGEKPFRDVELPQQTAKDKYVSQTVRTILEAKATPEIALKPIETLIAEGEFSYDRYTDKAAMADAEAVIKYKGWTIALDNWLKASRNGFISKKNTAIGWKLYNNAVNSNDMKTALEILSVIANNQRDAAQALQATRILKKLSPETQLYQAQRSVENLQREVNARHRKDGDTELAINEVLAKQFMEAETQTQRDEVLKEIYRDIGRQVPPTFTDKWRAWRYLAMLGNVRTHVRNTFGNAIFYPVVKVKNLLSTGMQSAAYHLGGKKLERTQAYGKDLAKLKKAAKGDYKNVADIISSGGKYGDEFNMNQYIREGQKIFTSKNAVLNAFMKPLEAARRGNSRLLEAEDRLFAKPHYAAALAKYCQANGITAEQIEAGEIPDAARSYAINEAAKATFRDVNVLSHFISRRFRETGDFKAGAKVLNAWIDGTLPFRKTPANILARGVEYSPVGLLNTIFKGTYDVAKGNKTGAEFIDALASGLTGTGIVGLGFALASMGLIRGHGSDDEKEREFEELMGHQAYSLELPNGESVTLDWLAPEALPFFVGVNWYEQSMGEDDGEPFTMSEGLGIISRISEPMLEMSCLQGLNDMFESVGYAASNDTSALVSIISSSLLNLVSQNVPTLSGQLERTTEDERQTTFVGKKDFLLTDLQRFLGKQSAKIPGWDLQQIPYIDAWGRTEKTGNVVERGFNNLLNPAYTSRIDESDMEKELKRLYKATGEGAVLPKRADKYFNVGGKTKYLDKDKYVKYATQKGKVAYDMLTDITSSREYKALNDREKAEVVSSVLTYANQKAKDLVSDFTVDAWVKDLDGAKKLGISEIDFITENKLRPSKVKDTYKTLTPEQRELVDSTVKQENNADLQRLALMSRTDLTPEQKAYIDKTNISELKNPIDYTSEESFYYSQLADAKKERYPEVKRRWNLDAKTYYRIIDACSGAKKKADKIARLRGVGFSESEAYRFYNVVFK